MTITPGGNPYCKHCKQLMRPGRNICYAGTCMCGETDDRHWAVEDHGYVDAAELLGWECKADDGS